MDQLPRLGKRELICLLLFTCNYVVSVWRGFFFLWVQIEQVNSDRKDSDDDSKEGIARAKESSSEGLLSV